MYLATAQSTQGSLVSWVTEYPLTPFLDYATFGTFPPTEDLGAFSLVALGPQDADSIWNGSRVSALNVTTLYPDLGGTQAGTHWRRDVDTEIDVTLTLSGTNLSTSWVRLSATDIAPRRQL
jgi:hypothetical protein